MRHKRLLAGVATVGLALAGCSNGGSDSGDGGDNTLEIWTFSSTMPDVIESEFATAYPEYDVDIVEVPIADVSKRLVVGLQGGEGLPDVVHLPLRESARLFATGQFLDMTAEFAPEQDNFPDGILVGNEDEINSFTMGPGNMGLWVNETALAKHDLVVPDDPTWDDIVDLATDLQAASGGEQYMFMQPPGANGANMFNAFFNSRGGTWWNERGELAADTELAVDTLEFMVDLDQQGLVYHGVWTEPTFWEAISNEEIVGWTMNYGVGHTNLQRNVPEQSGDWRLVTWPRWSPDAEQRTGVFGGSLFAGLRDTDNPDGAREFIMWWLTDEGLQAQIDTIGIVAYEPAAERVDLEREAPYFGGQTVLKDLGSVPYPPFHFFHWPETESAVTAAVDQAYSGDLSPRDAIDSIIAELEAL